MGRGGPRRDAGWLAWAVILGVALGLRVLAWWATRDGSPTGDAHNYIVIAGELLAGRGMAISDPYLGTLRAGYPPLMPLVLAGVGAFLPLVPATIAVLNTLIDGTCALLIHRLGAANGDDRAGVLAGIAYFCWPSNLALTPVAHKEALVGLLVVALALALTRLSDGGKAAFAMAFGIAAGLLALAQPGLALLAPLFVVAAWLGGRRPVRWGRPLAIAMLAGAAVMLPWWIRNWLVFGRFVPLTSVGGYSLWIGTTPIGDGRYLPPPPEVAHQGELAASAALGRAAIESIAADPVRALSHCAAKVLRAFASDDWAARKIAWHSARPLPTMLPALLAFVSTAAWFVALAGGAAAAALRRSWLPGRLLIAGFMQVVLFGMWFEFDQRHRYFLLPLLLVCAAHLLSNAPLRHRFRGRIKIGGRARRLTGFDKRRSSTVLFD